MDSAETLNGLHAEGDSSLSGVLSLVLVFGKGDPLVEKPAHRISQQPQRQFLPRHPLASKAGETTKAVWILRHRLQRHVVGGETVLLPPHPALSRQCPNRAVKLAPAVP